MTRSLALLVAIAACSSPTAPSSPPGRFITQGRGLSRGPVPTSFSARAEVDPLLGSTPVWTTRTVYIQSDCQWNSDGSTTNLNGDLTKHGCDPTDTCWDGRDGTSINAPFRTLHGLLDYYAVAWPPDGTTLDVVELADNRDADWDAPAKQITYGRVDWEDEIFVGASAAYIQSVTIRGPRGGWKRSADLTLTSHADETITDPTYGAGYKTGCVRLRFSPGNVASIGSYHLQWLRTDGREVMFPLAGTTDDVGNGYSYVCGGINDAGFTAAYNVGTGGAGNHFFTWTAGVLIHSSLGDGQMRGTHWYGEAAGRVGDRSSGSAPVRDSNLRGLVSRLQIGRSYWDVTGSYFVGEGVRLSDNAEFSTGMPRLRGVSVEGHLVFTSRGSLLTNASQLTLTEEAMGYMRSYTLPLSTTQGTGVDDPDYPISSPDFSISTTSDSYVQVGDEVGAAPGELRIFHGIGMRLPDAGVAIRVIGAGSRLFESKYDVNGIVLAAGVTGLWCEDGAVCAIDDASKDTLSAFNVGMNITGTDLVYRAGNGGALLQGPGPTRWAQSTLYTVGTRRMTDPSAGGNGYVYQVITQGTSSGSGSGPTGTAADITDGTAHWKYIAAGALRDSHAWNGYLSHRLEKTANGYPTDDDSVIRDRTWEASGYTTGR